MRFIRVSRYLTSIAAPLVVFPLVFFAQITIGYEVALFPLYMFPVAKLTWEFGWRGGVIAVMAATLCWYFGSYVAGQPYTHEWLRIYNAVIRGCVFASVAIFIVLFSRVVDQHRKRMEAMRALLNICHGCGAVQGSDGVWISFDDLLRRVASRQACECPSCAVREAGRQSQPDQK